MKPRLYLDVDDCIIANCFEGSGFDLRPGVMTQIRILSRLFDLVWLTCWPKKPLYELMRLLYGGRVNKDIRYADWAQGHPWRKAGYVLNPAQPSEFWWLEDPLCEEEIRALDEHGKIDRYVRVEPYGQWAFLDAVNELFHRCGFNDSDIRRVGGQPEWFKKEAVLAEDTIKENVREIQALKDEISELKAWKSEQMAVENSWDVQAVGYELNVRLGESVRPNILPAIRKLKDEITNLEFFQRKVFEALGTSKGAPPWDVIVRLRGM